MDLHEFGAEDHACIEAWVEVDRAAAALDCPWERLVTVHRQRMAIEYADGEPGRHFLVREAGEVVGTVALYSSEYDNLELAWVELVIAPVRRRAGLGSLALAATLDLCRAMGRSSVLLFGWESEAARGFAAAHGFGEKSVEVRRLQDLDGSGAQRALFTSLRDEALEHAGEYDVVRVLGRTPEDLLPGVVAVTSAINDAPTDDLDYEPEFYDIDRVRSYELSQELAGYRFRRVIARERRTGEVAAHSVVAVDAEQPEWAEQHDTAVLPAHRGHRLGLLLKAEMLLWLAQDEPQVRRVVTENAASNDAMIAINERLGHRVGGRRLLAQRRI